MGSLNIAREQLAQSWSALQRQWHTTEAQWLDRVQHRFRREFWAEYEQTVPAALKELDSLDRIIERIRREMP